MAITLAITTGTVAETYDDLKDLIRAWLNKGSSLDAHIPGFIEMAERRFNRVLVSPDRETDTTQTLSTAEISLPEDFWQLTSIWLETDPRVSLEQVSPQELRARYPSQATGQPAVFAISAGKMKFGPAPDGNYSLALTYIRKIPLLGDDVQSNWLLETHPDIYLYGSLLAAEAFLVNDERIPLWKAALDEALQELIDAGNRQRYSASPLRLRPSVSV